MDDFEKLINASDLIEWIMETYPDWCVGDVRSIVDHVMDLPSAQPEQRWIPVTERLPGEDDYRPCYGYEDGAVWWVNDMGLMGLGWYCPSTGKWAYYDESSGCEDRVGNVVAWTHLPEPARLERD